MRSQLNEPASGYSISRDNMCLAYHSRRMEVALGCSLAFQRRHRRLFLGGGSSSAVRPDRIVRVPVHAANVVRVVVAVRARVCRRQGEQLHDESNATRGVIKMITHAATGCSKWDSASL